MELIEFAANIFSKYSLVVSSKKVKLMHNLRILFLIFSFYSHELSSQNDRSIK